jgi:hypothetical protein
MFASLDVRTAAGYDVATPLCIYDLCEKAGVTVRFVDISMEGVYDRLPKPRIHVSALRPFGRRAFNCAHELGHHHFGHGSRIDELREELAGFRSTEADEFLVNAFAGFVLLPTLGLREAFAVRDLEPTTATPAQMLAIACSFGVGYATLVGHLAYGIRELSRSRAESLLLSTPKVIRTGLLGDSTTTPLAIADAQWASPTIDLEVGTQLLVPSGSKMPEDLLSFVAESPTGSLYRAERTGIARACPPAAPWPVFVRVMRHQYVGLARFRHFEDSEDD